MTSYWPSLTLQYALLPESPPPPAPTPPPCASASAEDRAAWLTMLASYPTDRNLAARCIHLVTALPGEQITADLISRVGYCVAFAKERQAASVSNIERIILAVVDGWDLFIGDWAGEYFMPACQ